MTLSDFHNLDFLDKTSVLVVGDIMLDQYICGNVNRISPEAPVPIVDINCEFQTLGGAANVAANLASLGVKCELLGIVGADRAGDELRMELKKQGIKFEWFIRSSTITKTRIVAHKQQICRIDKEQSPFSYSIDETSLIEVLKQTAKKYDAVIISDYAKGVVSQCVIDALRTVESQKNLFLALDPKPKHQLDIRGLDLLTPNRNEALQLSGLIEGGCSNEEIAQKIIEDSYPANLVITLGENGMLLAQSNDIVTYPTMAKQISDVSGAGDTSVAVLTVAIAGGLPAKQAVQLANMAAGIVVGKFGTATATRDELKNAIIGL